DRVAVMYAGHIVEQGPVGAIFDDPQHPYTIGLMNSVPALGGRRGRLTTIPGMVPLIDAMPAGCRFAPRCPFATEACRAAVPPLRSLGPGHAAACIHAPLEAAFAEAAR
ncbi:MAG: dipeptide ABC transporter ATP-binding protein DppD, partial [Kiloniellaceae bacterium]